MSQTILVTGGAGFIGANFIPYFMEKHPTYKVVNLDKLTYAGNLENLKEVENNPNYTFVQGDICDENFVDELFNKYNFTGVIHFAAESHVDNSIKGPRAFINTNIVGTFNLLETARKNWFDAPFTPKKGKENNRFHHISTDEVFGTLGDEG
ncbi:MAG: GDP-mannose 4,6-dehydratase, partial [Alphaproteobacteria bacterium]|nr:GDP-mannose 4,6-dehydratase [Alphaproteobacteria bacterium]